MIHRTRGHGFLLAVAVVLALIAASTASAQSTTASIRGTVNDATGAIPGATVTLVNTESGFNYSSVTEADGSFSFAGLAPASYELRVNLEGFQEQVQVVRVLVGQTLTLKVELKQKAMFLDGVTVVGDKVTLLVDTRSSSISTNITPQQIENLPQNNRNFLSFAGARPRGPVHRQHRRAGAGVP